LSCSNKEIRSFLLKIYLENHEPTVDGNADHCIMHIKIMMQCVKIVTEAIEKENTRDQRKIKIATLAYFHVCINTDTSCIYTTKSVVSLKKDYKIL